MAIVNHGGFETGDLLEGVATGAGATAVTSPVHSGSYAMRCHPAVDTAAYLQIRQYNSAGLQANLSQNNCHFSFWLRVATAPQTAEEPIVDFNKVGPFYADCTLDSNRRVGLWTPSLELHGTTQLSLNVWHLIEILVGSETGNGTLDAPYQVKVDGNVEINGTNGDFGSGVWTQILLGRNYVGVATNNVDFYFDDWALDDAASPGDARTLAGKPTADATYVEWAPDDAGANCWSRVDEFPNDGDSSYIYSTEGVNGRATFTYPSAATIGLPTGWNILSAKITSIHRKFTIGAARTRIMLKLDSTVVETDNDNIGLGYTLRARVLPTDPRNGLPWTASAFNAVEAGPHNATATSIEIRCTQFLLQLLCRQGATDQIVQVGTISTAVSLPGPTVLPGAVTVSIGPVGTTAGLPPISPSPGPASVPLAPIPLTAALPPAHAVPGPTVVQVAPVGMAAGLPAVTPSPGPASVPVARIPLAASLPPAQAVPGLAVIQVAPIGMATGLPALHPSPGPATVALGSIPLAASLPPAASLAGGLVTVLGPLGLAASLPGVVALPGAARTSLAPIPLHLTLLPISCRRGMLTAPPGRSVKPNPEVRTRRVSADRRRIQVTADRRRIQVGP